MFHSLKNMEAIFSNGIILLHSHPQYVNKHFEKFQRSGLKSVGGVDYPKQVPYIDSFCEKKTKFQKMENIEKNLQMASYCFMHILNMYRNILKSFKDLAWFSRTKFRLKSKFFCYITSQNFSKNSDLSLRFDLSLVIKNPNLE